MSVRTQRIPLGASAGVGEALVPMALFAAFLAVYSIYPNNYPHHDELYHVLTGASYAADGTLALGDRIYGRTPLFTMLIGELFKTFGVSLPVARAPSVLATAVWVVVVYLFVRPAAGRLAATVAALGFGLSPLVADIAKMARFYALHGLFFSLAAISIYWATAVASGASRRAAGYLAASVCLLAALYLQLTTVIGAAGLAAWVAGYAAISRFGLGRRLLPPLLIGGAAALALLMIAYEVGLAERALEPYRRTAAWAADLRDYEGFYLDLLLEDYPVFLPLFPLATLIAFLRAPRLTTFCALLFGLGAVLHSFGGMKAERYLTYLMPFFWIVLGITIARLLTPALILIRTLIERVGNVTALQGLPRPWVVGAVRAAAAASVVWLLAVNLALPTTFHKLVYRLDSPTPEWAALPEAVGLDRGTIFLTPNDLHALYFIGDLHADIGPPALAHLASQTGRPFLTSAATLAKLIACSPTGVIASDAWRWQNPGIVAEEVRTFAERHLDPHPAGPSLNMILFIWDHENADGPACPAPYDRPLQFRPLAS